MLVLRADLTPHKKRGLAMKAKSEPPRPSRPSDLFKKGSWTPHPDRPIEVLTQSNLCLSEYKIFEAIMRLTLGFDRRVAFITIKALMEITGLSKRGVLKATASLLKRNIITRNGYYPTRKYEVNLHHTTWKDLKKKSASILQYTPARCKGVHLNGEANSASTTGKARPSKETEGKQNKGAGAKVCTSQPSEPPPVADRQNPREKIFRERDLKSEREKKGLNEKKSRGPPDSKKSVGPRQFDPKVLDKIHRTVKEMQRKNPTPFWLRGKNG